MQFVSNYTIVKSAHIDAVFFMTAAKMVQQNVPGTLQNLPFYVVFIQALKMLATTCILTVCWVGVSHVSTGVSLVCRLYADCTQYRGEGQFIPTADNPTILFNTNCNFMFLVESIVTVQNVLHMNYVHDGCNA